MQHQWFSHLPQDKREEFKQLVLNSSTVLDRLKDIVYNMSKNGEESKTEDYDSPSWAYRQADKNGQLRAYRDILKLLDIRSDQDKGHK